MSDVPRMRTIQQCVSYLKEQDPGSCIGEWRVRKIIKQGKIPVIHAGNKALVNLDKLLSYLSGEQNEEVT